MTTEGTRSASRPVLPTWRTVLASGLVSAALITMKADPFLLHELHGLALGLLFAGSAAYVAAGIFLWWRHRNKQPDLARLRGAQASVVLGVIAWVFPLLDHSPLKPATPVVAASPSSTASNTPTTPLPATPTATPSTNSPTPSATAIETPTEVPTSASAAVTTSAPVSAAPPTPSASRSTAAVPVVAPGRLSDHDVLIADPSCVGGVCELLARTDMVRGSTRTTLAFVRYPDDSYLGTDLGFFTVDAGTREIQRGVGGSDYGVEVPTAQDIHIDRQGNIASITRSTRSYSQGELSLIGAGISGSNPFLSTSTYGTVDSIAFLDDDANGYMRWQETSSASDGGTTLATYGWTGYSFGATDCSLTRNGETVTRKPNGSGC